MDNQPGLYNVTMTDPNNGCSATVIRRYYTKYYATSISATNNGPITCIKTSVTLTANPATGVTYVWSNGGQTTRTKTVTSPGTYTVTVTDVVNGCTAVSTTTVTGDTSLPNVSATNDGPLTCAKTSVTLAATGSSGVSYNWSGGGSASTKV
ncbi:MAG: hypothetical protein R2774_14880 [Saprospiraceae bacterium]